MAQIKKLPIRQHDTQSNRGGQRLGQRVASAALRRTDGIQDQQAREGLRDVLGQLLEQEQAKGVRSTRAGVRQRRSDRERQGLAVRGAVDPLARLKRNTQLATEKFAHDLRRSEIVAAGQGPDRKQGQQRRMSGANNAHARMMVMQAMSPLRQGVDLGSVMQAMGAMGAMYMLSPQVRSVVGDYRPRIVSRVKQMIQDRSSDRLDAKAMDKLEAARAKGKDGTSLGERWQRRLDRMENAGPDFREPFTNETAAMVEIGLAESAYAAMRDPSIPADKLREHRMDVLASFESARQVLDEYIAEDGLDREEVSQAARVQVGRRLESEPHLASVFGELGHGRFVRSEPQEMYVRGKSKPQMVWTGDFTDAVSDLRVSSGSFSLRMPGGRGDHLEACATTLEAELEDATTLEDLNEMFTSYTAASVVRQYPDMPDEVDDPVVKQRMRRAGAMFSSMRADGISQPDQRFIYAAAFVDAMEKVEQTKPELVGQWEAQFGPDWQAGVREVVQSYSDMGARGEDRVLIQALVNRGFDEQEATEEVSTLRAEHSADPDAGPLMAQPLQTVSQPGDVPHPGQFEASVPRRAKEDRAVVLMEQMSEWIAADLAHEADKAGQYEPNSSTRLTGPGSGQEKFIGSDVFLRGALDTYTTPAVNATLGSEIKRTTGLSDTEKRWISLSRMYGEMDKMGIPKGTQDAMMSAACVNGLERLISREPFHEMVVEERFDIDADWRDSMYDKTLEGTQAYRLREDPSYQKFSPRPSAEQLAQRQAHGREGYSVWEREFDRLDEIEVAGQAKIGELDIPGADTMRDNVASNVNELGDEVAASAAQQVRRRRRAAVRKNQAYNEYGRTEGLAGIGSDDVALHQDGDNTPGREMEFGG